MALTHALARRSIGGRHSSAGGRHFFAGDFAAISAGTDLVQRPGMNTPITFAAASALMLALPGVGALSTSSAHARATDDGAASPLTPADTVGLRVGPSEELRLETERRDPMTAFTMSLALGFGAGYSSQWMMGSIFAAAQLTGVGMMAGGIPLLVAGRTAEETDQGEILTIAGVLTTLVGRTVDAAWAPISAHDRNAELLLELGVTPTGNGGAIVGRF